MDEGSTGFIHHKNAYQVSLMFKSRQVKIFFQVFIAFVLTGFSMGESSRLIDGLSPYSSSVIQFEETAFIKIQKIAAIKENAERKKRLQAQEEERKLLLRYEEKVKDKIRQVISNYRGRMSSERIQQIQKSILAESKTHNYDPLFLTALIITESSFNSKARSNKGALGLMQIIPRTGAALAQEKNMQWQGNPTLYNPKTNIALGAYYLKKMHKRFGDLNLALEAYNHGPTKLDRYLKRGYQPRRYSTKVLEIYEMIDFEPT
jgi:soluble lytic murein transglycosylase-like protein